LKIWMTWLLNLEKVRIMSKYWRICLERSIRN
jgi:hypothetical protein